MNAKTLIMLMYSSYSKDQSSGSDIEKNLTNIDLWDLITKNTHEIVKKADKEEIPLLNNVKN